MADGAWRKAMLEVLHISNTRSSLPSYVGTIKTLVHSKRLKLLKSMKGMVLMFGLPHMVEQAHAAPLQTAPNKG